MLQFIITFKTSILDITSNFCFQIKSIGTRYISQLLLSK